MEKIFLIVTLRGDRTSALTKCGTQNPFKLNADGNTEVETEVWRGGAQPPLPTKMVMALGEPMILRECSKMGEVISHKWVTMETTAP